MQIQMGNYFGKHFYTQQVNTKEFEIIICATYSKMGEDELDSVWCTVQDRIQIIFVCSVSYD